MKFICAACTSTFPVTERRWRCDCGGYLDLQFKASFPRDHIGSRPWNMWRYREALPLLDDPPVSLGESVTGLADVVYQGRQVQCKLDYLFPTGSYKDRGAAVMISRIRALGADRVLEDSSGNAGSSVAAYAARAGIEAAIYVPEATSPGKLKQISSYGASLTLVPGDRDATSRAAESAAGTGWYASHVWDPFFLHGTKTFAFELAEQMGWQAPETLVIPVGNGTLFLGAWIGFNELLEAGVISAIPRFYGIQAANCAPLYSQWNNATFSGAGKTAAEGIAIPTPLRKKQILEAARVSGGAIFAVGEEEIVRAHAFLAGNGLYVEPTSAVALAGTARLENPRGSIVIPLTGIGLKSDKK